MSIGTGNNKITSYYIEEEVITWVLYDKWWKSGDDFGRFDFVSG